MNINNVVKNVSAESYDYATFYNHFAEICMEHQASSKALAFAFILYDFQDSALSHILQNQIYWRALDVLTGEYLTVYSINYTEKKRTRKRPGSIDTTMKRMVKINYDHNPSYGSFELLEKYFDVGIDIHFPALLLFQVKDGNVLTYSIVQLDEKEIEKAFEELKEYLQRITMILKKITDENKGNLKEIFDLIKSVAEGHRLKKISVKTFKAIVPFHRLLSIIAGFNGK